MKRISLLLGSLVLSATATLPAVAGTVYSQPASTNPFIPGWFSETGGSTPTQAFDDFTLSTTAAFSTVSWQALTTSGVDISQFTISIYDNSVDPGVPPATGSIPAQSLATYVVNFADANATNISAPGAQLTTYTFSANLTTPFTATAGTQYWITILATISGGDYTWALGNSTGRDGYFLSADSSGVSEINALPVDLAFTLSTPGVTPEPSALVLLGTGLLGSVGLLRRRVARP